MYKYGPWDFNSCISDLNGKQIISVSSKQLSNWVIKVKTNKDIDELTSVLCLRSNPPRNMVEMPDLPYYRFGQIENKVWYAMKKYDGHVTKEHSSKWRSIAITIIQFMSDLHRKYRKVYMDCRMENILVSGDTFVVADYELINPIENLKTKEIGCDKAWYFYAKGAEPNKWIYSWRQDLVSLGYLLVQLTADLPFHKDFMNRRFGQRVNHKSTRDILKERDTVINELSNSTLQAYFTLIKKVPWNSYIPQAASFYEELETLFRV